MPGPAFLSGDDVTLRTIETEDLEFLQREVNDPKIWRPIGRSTPLNAEQEREFFEDIVCDDDGIHLLVAADSEPVGTIGLNSINREARRAELGYWIATEHHGRGYGTEAAKLLVEHGFDQLGLHRISARVFEFNDASKRLLESVGFTEEGVHRDTEFIDGEFQDTHWYGLLEDEWRLREP
ncbi:GNAT family N-acetyltransferase [Natronococcus pandeyae]|uniref:GNAT family N-acetyltransferase n=1 Tax=Natronococcus pandeyae TaxID=2055836 RepID=A0A8J8Q0Q5_9EURY|nr:GNAT family protein [Natronococcus pandeyae]TYL36837.1 GNAT family N-acetyltransferase [Natronococcus pandeyae]